MCHLVLLLPVLALPVFWLAPLSLALPLYAGIAVASLALYTYAIRAMRMPPLNGTEALLGAQGRVVDVREREATLLLGAELWSAIASGEQLALGDKALVAGIDGLRLRVKKVTVGGSSAAEAIRRVSGG